MKIIQPAPIDKTDIVTNAPLDPYSRWELVGRDFSLDWTSPLVAAAGDDLYVCRTPADSISDANIRYHSLSSETRIDAPITDVGIRTEFAELSPDGAWLAIIGRNSADDPKLRVFSTASGTLVYSSFIDGSTNRVGRRPMDWAPDSSSIAFFRYGDEAVFNQNLAVVVVSTANWSETVMPYIRIVDGANSDLREFRIPALCFSKDGTDVYVVAHMRDVSDFLQTRRHRYKLMRFDVTGGNYSSLNLQLPEQSYAQFYIAHNPYRDEVLLQGYNTSGGLAMRAFDQANLSEKSTVPVSGPAIDTITVSPGADEVLVTTNSAQPYHRRFVASTYAAGTNLDGVIGSRSPYIDYSASYYVCSLQSGGFTLIGLADDQPVSQVKPSVLEGDIYIYQDEVFEALTDNQDRPDEGALLTPPTWLSLGPVNPYRMIDGKISTITEANGDLEIEATLPGLIDGLALFGVEAQSVQIQLEDSVEGIVFDSGEISLLDNTSVTDFYQYFYSPIAFKPDFVFPALPPYQGAVIRVLLSNNGAGTKLGELVLGSVREVGDTLFGVGVGILDFSRKERDTFGNFVITERSYSKRANYPVSVRSSRIAFVQQLLAALRATPVVFIGAESQPETVVYGFYRGFDLVLDGPMFSECSIEVEGLT